jgi:hypothetical protein
VTENYYKKWFVDKKFMDSFLIKDASISEFLFVTSREREFSKVLDAFFDEFLMECLEEATENEELPIDIILMLVEIESISDFMKKKFITIAKMDHTILEDNVLDTLISLICDPSRFFNIFRGMSSERL